MRHGSQIELDVVAAQAGCRRICASVELGGDCWPVQISNGHLRKRGNLDFNCGDGTTVTQTHTDIAQRIDDENTRPSVRVAVIYPSPSRLVCCRWP